MSSRIAPEIQLPLILLQLDKVAKRSKSLKRRTNGKLMQQKTYRLLLSDQFDARN